MINNTATLDDITPETQIEATGVDSTKAHLVLALDYGVKKMGMALGNTLTKNARPFDILAMTNGQPDWDNLIGIIDKWDVELVVVGLPLNMDGSSSMLSPTR